MSFFQTKGGQRFIEGVVPRGVRALEAISREMKRANDLKEKEATKEEALKADEDVAKVEGTLQVEEDTLEVEKNVSEAEKGAAKEGENMDTSSDVVSSKDLLFASAGIVVVEERVTRRVPDSKEYDYINIICDPTDKVIHDGRRSRLTQQEALIADAPYLHSKQFKEIWVNLNNDKRDYPYSLVEMIEHYEVRKVFPTTAEAEKYCKKHKELDLRVRALGEESEEQEEESGIRFL